MVGKPFDLCYPGFLVYPSDQVGLVSVAQFGLLLFGFIYFLCYIFVPPLLQGAQRGIHGPSPDYILTKALR